MHVHIENSMDDDCTLIQDLVDSINHLNFSACLDIGHVNVHSTKSIEFWIKGLNKRIGHVHLHNNDGSFDNHYGLNRGTIDMLKVLEMLKINCPNSTWTLEIVDVKDLIESINFLKINGFI
jgi:sugar phosphate isomerase/epimerase